MGAGTGAGWAVGHGGRVRVRARHTGSHCAQLEIRRAVKAPHGGNPAWLERASAVRGGLILWLRQPPCCLCSWRADCARGLCGAADARHAAWAVDACSHDKVRCQAAIGNEAHGFAGACCMVHGCVCSCRCGCGCCCGCAVVNDHYFCWQQDIIAVHLRNHCFTIEARWRWGCAWCWCLFWSWSWRWCWCWC